MAMCKSTACQHEKETLIRERNHQRTVPYEKSAAFLCPNLIEEHCGPSDLKSIAPGSHLIQNWSCANCGNKWSTELRKRAVYGHGCKPCAEKAKMKIRSAFPYEKSVAFLYPHLVKEHQGPGDLGSLSPNSCQLQDWKCLTCNHKWQAKVQGRAIRNEG